MTSATDTIQALVVGGVPADTRRSSGELNLGTRITTAFASELNDAFACLSSNFFDVILLNADFLGVALEQAIGQFMLLSPGSLIIVFDFFENEAHALRLLQMGATDCFTHEETTARSLRRSILKEHEKGQGGVWLQEQISETLLTSTFEGVVVLDENLNILLWNPAMERIFEVERGDINGVSYQEVLAELSVPDEETQLIEALRGKRVVSRDRYFANASTGKTGFYTAFYNPMRNRRGQIVGAVGIVKDVTNSKINERMVSEMAHRMLALTNASSNMQWISDSENERIFFNRRWLEFVGNELDDERGCGWRRHIHPDDLRRYRELVETAMDSRMPWHAEMRLKGSDGKYKIFFESAFPLFLPDQSFIGYVGFCTDFNATRTTSPKMPAATQNAHTFNALEMSPIGIVNLDADLIVRNANKRVSDLFGISSSHLIGRRISDILGAFDLTTLHVVLSRGERIQLDNHRIILETDEGEHVRYWDIACWPQKNSSQQTSGICMSFIEATERYEISQEKEEFVAALVHDLKTPLIGAEKTLDAMRKGALGPVQNEHEQMLAVLQKSNQSLLTMVQSVIDMHRCENDILNLSLQSMAISSLVRECANELTVLFSSHGITLKFQADEKLEKLRVMGDRMALRRVILNLLDNALKFTPYGGTVVISLRSEGAKVCLDIADSGIGISDDEQEKIFGKSFQGTVGRKVGGSAGIGLFVCRKIVRSHSGDIRVARNAVGGSTFTIELPRHSLTRTLISEAV